MNASSGSNSLRITHLAGHDGGEATLRIDYDRRRLLLTALASAFAVATTSLALVLALEHMGRLPSALLKAPGLDPELVTLIGSIPAWAPLALGVAALLAILRMLGNFYRLQDGDPAFVLSPRDLRFKTGLFGESVRIPWNALRAVRTRRNGKHRSIVLRVDALDRYVPRTGLLALRRNNGEIALRTPLSRAALDELAALLQARIVPKAAVGNGSEAGKQKAASASARSPAGSAAD